MKRKLLFLAALAVSALGFNANAQDYTAKVGIANSDWGVSGAVGGKTVETFDGRSAGMPELYGNSKAGVKLQQTVSGLDDGKYDVTVYATSHNAREEDFASLDPNVDDANSIACIFATASNGTNRTFFTAQANADYVEGEPYKVTVSDVAVIGGQLIVGLEVVKAEKTGWHSIQIYQLTRTGDITKEEVLAELSAKATELKADPAITATTLAALESAISGATAESMDELKAAIKQAELDVLNRPAVDAISEIIANNNFVTPAALATFKEVVDKFEEGNYTEYVVNPTNFTTWHREPHAAADYLISGWDVGKATDWASYHVNTWSKEGHTDGSGFIVPFIEYWTGDADVLAAKTLTATVNDVEPGLYAVSAWVRVRTTNGKDPKEISGITLSVNDGEAVDVTKGTQTIPTGEGYFNLAEYKAIGTVGEDGKLTIKFDVNTENISWLSFKNVNYVKTTKEQIEYEKALAEITDGHYYQIYTTVEEKDYYLKTDGKLTDNKEEAGNFEFKAENAEGTLYETGWNLGYKFTNPNMSGNNGTGNPKNEGGIRPDDKNDRADWERQVFFLGDNGEYAVRATNSTSANWGANTYWAVVDGTDAGYSLEAAYVWKLEDVTATEEDYEALNNALAAVADKTLGFEEGQYAPYTNVDGAKALTAAKALNQEVANAHATVAAITEALTEAEWTANTEEMNGIYDGTFKLQDEHTQNSSPYVPFLKGWTGVNKDGDNAAIRQLVKNVDTYPGLEYATDKAAVFSWSTTTLTYGEQGGYTLPLNGNTVYNLTLKVAAWQDGDIPTSIQLTVPNANVVNSSESITVKRLNTKDGNPFAEVSFNFVTAEAGDYAVKLYAAGHYVVTDFELYKATTPVEVSDAGYATYVTAEDVEFGDEVEAYVVSGLNEDNTVATLEQITEAPAGTPVVIKAEKADTYELKVVAEAKEVGVNLLKVATGEETGEGIYVLANLNEVVGFYALEEGVTVPAGKAYLKVDAANGIKFIGFEGNGGATGIQGVENAAAEAENGAIYNLAGQRVQNPTKGIYIVNGKKVLVK